MLREVILQFVLAETRHILSISQVYSFGKEMVQSWRVDPSGYGPVLLSDPRLWGPSGFGSGPVLEALWMGSVQSPTSFVSGHFIHGLVPRQPPAAPGPTARPLLRLVLREVYHGASDCHGVGAWTGLPFHSQKEELMGTLSTD